MAEKYIQEGIIGEGGYGRVYKVKCVTTGKYFALKVHLDGQQNHDEFGISDATVREISCLSALTGHPCVIEMLDCFIYGNNIATLMPMMPYVLSEAIYTPRDHRGHIPLSFVAHFSTQVGQALSYMHGLNILHRDLTPNNVLLTEHLDIKVADMGLARQASALMSPDLGTICYRAPELYVYDTLGEYTCAVDMWSLGVMMADVMENKTVFGERQIDDHKYLSTYDVIKKSLCPKREPCSSDTLDLVDLMPNVMRCAPLKKRVLKLLAFDPSERILASELLNDTEWRWLAEMTYDEKTRMLHVLHKRKKQFE